MNLPEFRKNESKSDIENALFLIKRKTLLPEKKNNGIGILSTGGLDSLLLSYLTKNCNPHLFFGAIADISTIKYNLSAIKNCKYIANLLNLKFSVIRIAVKEYVKSIPKTVSLMDKPVFDQELPAVYVLFSKIGEALKASSLILSGMGNNEIFELQGIRLKGYLLDKAPLEISMHKILAKHCNLNFYAPFLEPSFVNYVSALSRNEKKNRAIIRRYLASKNVFSRATLSQTTKHSHVPISFLSLACKLYKEDSFQNVVKKLWSAKQCI